MLEPDEGKLSSPVLRGLAPSNGGGLLGTREDLLPGPVYGPRNEGRRKRTRVCAIAGKIIVGFYLAELARASNRQPQGLKART